MELLRKDVIRAGQRLGVLCGLGGALVALIALVHSAGTGAHRPNIVLIVLDTVRDDYVGRTWGDVALTPSVDAITAEGTRFVNAFAPAPWTVPSHASLFTGLYPHQHGADHEHFALAEERVTLAERLRAAGYATAGITCNPWLSSGLGFARGFDHYVAAYRDSTEYENTSGRASLAAIDWLRGRAGQAGPFFLFINYLDAHLPYTPTPDTLGRLTSAAVGAPRTSFSVAEAERCISGTDRLTAWELQDVRRLYAGEVADQDVQVGRVLTFLRDSGLLDDTLLVITADHGEQLGEHELMGHEFTVYDAVLRVPLIVRYPAAFPAGRRATLHVSLIDILPTVMDVTGVDVTAADRLPGRSLRYWLGAPDGEERALLAEYARPATLIGQYWRSNYPELDMSRYDTSLRALRVGRLKYIVAGTGREQLYDVHDDPLEEWELSADRAAEVRRMRARLAALELAP